MYGGIDSIKVFKRMADKNKCLNRSLSSTYYLKSILYFMLTSGLNACTGESNSQADISDMSRDMLEEQLDSTFCAGEAHGGKVSAGEVSAGESTAGEVRAGEVNAGEPTAGEVSAGESTAGEASAGESSAGEVSAGESSAGEVSAGEASAGSVMMANPEISSRYDGDYFATFESVGLKVALARVELRAGLIEGEVLNRSGELIQLGGFVDENGMLRIPSLIGSMGNTFTITGRVSRWGLIEGTFIVSGVTNDEGSFAGSLENQSIYQPSHEYDGLYDLSFIHDEQEIAVTPMSIHQGRLSLQIVTISGERFEANGFVSEDGTLTFLGTVPTDILAEGFIDPDTKSIKGIYKVNRGEEALIGYMNGREAD